MFEDEIEDIAIVLKIETKESGIVYIYGNEERQKQGLYHPDFSRSLSLARPRFWVAVLLESSSTWQSLSKARPGSMSGSDGMPGLVYQSIRLE
jgi:hypothetical protein